MEDYKVRFVKEYEELEIKASKLKSMITKYHAGVLHFEPTCPIELLEKQLKIMTDYLNVLLKRAKLEDIKL